MYLSYTFNGHVNTYSQQYQHQLGQDFGKTVTKKQYQTQVVFYVKAFTGGSRDCWDRFGLLRNLQQYISSSQVPVWNTVSYKTRGETRLIWHHPHRKVRIMSCFQVSATDETVKINNVHSVTKKTLKSLKSLKLQITFKRTMKQPRLLWMKSLLQFLGVQCTTPYKAATISPWHAMVTAVSTRGRTAPCHHVTWVEKGNVAQVQPQVVLKKNGKTESVWAFTEILHNQTISNRLKDDNLVCKVWETNRKPCIRIYSPENERTSPEIQEQFKRNINFQPSIFSGIKMTKH